MNFVYIAIYTYMWVYHNTTGASFFALFCSRQAVEETDASDSSDVDDKERLGDKLYSLVEKLDPLRANDITGEVSSHQ